MAYTSVIMHFFLISLALFSVSSLSATQPPTTTKPHPFILPIRKDPSTNLFYTSVGIGTPRTNFNLAIDLAGENLWYDCDTHYNSSSYTPIQCGSTRCTDTACVGCNGPFKPGCTNNTCAASATNSLAKFIFGGGLGEDFIFISQQKVSGLLSSCIDIDGFSSTAEDDSPLNGLPKNTKGIFGLARSNLSLPTQLALKNKLQPKFSLCLPSSNKQGFTNLLVGSIAGDPFHELSKFVQTTPLIVNPVPTGAISVQGASSIEYFIDVKAVKIDGNVLNIKPSLLSIDKKGNGGTKISTISPFTELQTSVYKPFIRDFLKKASDRKLKRVESVAPFEACFDSSSIKNSVPRVDLVLQGGVQWTIHEANLMVNVKKNVACLGFVDGGTEPRMSFTKTSIVIGGHQLEDNLLVFDLASSKLSFSSSLLVHSASCS
ncbi:probable aspartic proteinase GIP2 [Medicago truncatula]|uniref:Extracellular dermal glycoprotein n=1 Tax=Medicago truncatula TaxID=3880 RepID=A0A072V549_MEDTR|nr:probable aspartic proteinase GIP2 [Medicago truncatula]KEH36786.1 extracellular dermal glycoprotein [Medicago truncatula]